jgi:UDP-N-acetylglucosamine 2-epimerase (non-hydrolysing)
MIDTLVRMRRQIDAAGAARALGLEPGGYAVLTMHRPSNVDVPERLAAQVAWITELAARLPVVFPVHPRTRRNLERFGLLDDLAAAPGLHLLEPRPYVAFMSLVADARLVVTDSGGLQEETTYLGIPCVTQRTSTERPVTTTQGTNVLTGESVERARAAVARILDGETPRGSVPPCWDGRCAGRIVALLAERLGV